VSYRIEIFEYLYIYSSVFKVPGAVDKKGGLLRLAKTNEDKAREKVISFFIMDFLMS
jgi:hypothetical protein